ncbi:tRNA glutamyl-Q(34) synthetase GluQRS [Kaarinaea lacus]
MGNLNLYRGRFAPSPTGPLHFGSLVSAVASYLQARSKSGSWLVRIEDIDPPREMPGSSDSILRTLEQHGLYWDEPVLFQSQQSDRYISALEKLNQQALLYNCRCSRKTISEAQHSLGISIYPGTCRNQSVNVTPETATRVIADERTFSFEDRIQGEFTQQLAREVGDFVLRRADGLFAYQLAVVIDDAYQRISEVVRGSDLLDNTPRQIMLQDYLALPTPGYAHHPVATNAVGEKLSKQTFARPVDDSPAIQNIVKVLDFLGQNPPEHTEFSSLDTLWDWAILHWDIENIPRQKTITVEL